MATQTEAAEIKVLSTGGARAVMTSLVPEFERKSGHKVILDFGTPGNMRDRLIQGEAADVAVAIAAVLPDLEKAGKIASGTRMEFAASYVGVVMRAGAPKLDVSTPEGVKRAILGAKTVLLSDPKAGTQLGATFIRAADRLGFGPELRSRTKMILGPGSDVAAAVAKGEGDLGVTLISEILPVTGAALGGELPVQHYAADRHPCVRGIGGEGSGDRKSVPRFPPLCGRHQSDRSQGPEAGGAIASRRRASFACCIR